MCGIIGVLSPPQYDSNSTNLAATQVYKGLLTLQHRGQDAAGILSYENDAKRYQLYKDEGLVTEVFKKEKLETLKGSMAIGHCRYPTIDIKGNHDLQPLTTPRPFGIGMTHNGNILNYHDLQRHLQNELNIQVLSENDLEVMLQLWSYYLENACGNEGFSFAAGITATKNLMDKLNGGYSVIGTIAGKGMFGFRDPNGIRPLVIGKSTKEKNSYCFASETHPLNYLDYEYDRDLLPGEFVFIDMQGNLHSSKTQEATEEKMAPCMFEWVYFASAESAINNRSVYRSRLELGKKLAQKVKVQIDCKKISPDIICPVPDTARTASIALAEELKIPYREGLIKNRYVQRSFILSGQEEREKAVELKLSPVISEIRGKNILLVDDSVVRGTTSKKIISLLKKYGANEISLAITCPPIAYACYYGIDFPDAHKLAANNKTMDQIATWVGAKEVIYLEENDLREAIGLDNLCMACVNNKYPTDITNAKEFMNNRTTD